MKNYITTVTLIIALIAGCKTQESTISIEDLSPSIGQTAVIGKVISYEEPVLLIQVEKAKQGGAAAPKVYPKETEFMVTVSYTKFHKEKYGESVKEILKKGKTIGFTCTANNKENNLEISQIIKP